MAAGDLIVMHGEMIHSGTANAVDSAIRAYVSTFVTRVGWPHRDNFGPSRSRSYLWVAALARG